MKNNSTHLENNEKKTEKIMNNILKIMKNH